MFLKIRIATISIFVTIIAISVLTCGNIKDRDFHEKNTMAVKTIEEVLGEHNDELMSIPGVVGTAQGICDDKSCIKVYVIKKTSELNQKIPNILEGYMVVIEETGEFRALPKNKK